MEKGKENKILAATDSRKVMLPEKLLFATRNKGKLEEVRDIFKGSRIEIISLLEYDDAPEVIEDGLTFEDNARKKARIIYNHYRIPAIADDSGLSVDQLGGQPGVYSARYAGKHATDADNNKKLLRELSNHSEPHPAKFVCCAAYYDGEDYISTLGHVAGKIINKERGSSGFGYDPVFVPDGYDKTMAELGLDVKNKISHRFKAFSALYVMLASG